MALVEVKVPQLSESVAEASLLEWHKKEGEAVARDENLIDIETDKVVLELPAPESGVLVSIVRQAGDTVVAGEVLKLPRPLPRLRLVRVPLLLRLPGKAKALRCRLPAR